MSTEPIQVVFDRISDDFRHDYDGEISAWLAEPNPAVRYCIMLPAANAGTYNHVSQYKGVVLRQVGPVACLRLSRSCVSGRTLAIVVPPVDERSRMLIANYKRWQTTPTTPPQQESHAKNPQK